MLVPACACPNPESRSLALTAHALRQAMNSAYDAWVPKGHTSPRATVQALLADPKWLIEVVCTAAAATPAAL